MNWADIARLREQHVHVVGLASTEGTAIAMFLWSQGVRHLTVHDFQEIEDVRTTFFRMHVAMPRAERQQLWEQLQSLPIARCFGAEYLRGVEQADAIFVGQAWTLYPPNLPRLELVRDSGTPFHSMVQLYFDLSPAPILAVTGSNGKSTTSRLAEAMLQHSALGVHFAGNERHGVQVLDKLQALPTDDVLVLEISNRQLVGLEPHPHIGVVTTVLPNHLEEHDGSFAEYAAIKRRLVAFQEADDFAVLNADDDTCWALGKDLPGRVVWFSSNDRVPSGAWIVDDRIQLRLEPGDPPLDAGPASSKWLPGEHNISNMLAAAVSAWLAGAAPDDVARGIAGFRGLRHRIQFVWRADDVDYYDDLNATSPQATAAALKALPRPLMLIAGGDDKGLPFDDLAREVVGKVSRLLLLPGLGSDRLEDAVRGAATHNSPEIVRHSTLEEAVVDAVAAARPGDTVLLSPSCPGFFSRYYAQEKKGSAGYRALLREHARGRANLSEGKHD